jgi:hypothetical protein
MKVLQILVVTILALSMTSCGSSGGDGNSAREFAQSVDKVVYQINQLEVSANLGVAGENESEKLQKSFGRSARAADSIQRIIKGPAFVLVFNGSESALQVSSGEKINQHHQAGRNTPGCSLSGESSVEGEVTSLKIALNWHFVAHLNGDACDAAMLEDYFKFQSDELSLFHLSAVEKLLSSADLPKDQQRNIDLQVRIEGDSH